MSEKQTGWAYVAVQVLLLVLVLFLPDGTAWEVNTSVRAFGLVINIAGLLLLAFAALSLGRSLTPTPVPVENAELKTTGLYSRMRHPIYTGVMLLAIGIAGASGSRLRALFAVALVIFFNVKARWEEEMLIKKFGRSYETYAATVNRFVPTGKTKKSEAVTKVKESAVAERTKDAASKAPRRGYTEGKGRATPKRPPRKKKR